MGRASAPGPALLAGSYRPDAEPPASRDAEELLSGYSALLYGRLGSYAAVAERTGLDPRTSRKYVLGAKSG